MLREGFYLLYVQQKYHQLVILLLLLSGNHMHVFTYLIYRNYFTVQGKYILISVTKKHYKYFTSI